MDNFLKKINLKKDENKSKRKIENLIFLIIILVITVVLMNTIWNGDKEEKNAKPTNTYNNKVLAQKDEIDLKDELEQKLEVILSTIKNVGRVNVLLNYSETGSTIPIYDETTTTSKTEEGDSSGGTRNLTETQIQKDVVFSESSGSREPVTQKNTMPIIQGAIITAEGANDVTVKTNIINAISAVTGLSIDKVQVFELGEK